MSTASVALDDYLKQEKLKSENRGSEGYLSDEQTQLLVQHLTEFTYAHTHQIVAYVYDRRGIKYTVSGLNKCLPSSMP